MAPRALSVVVLAVFIGCAQDRSPIIANAIPNIPQNQQRVVTRSELDWQWPFAGGVGALGCVSGAVVFRFDGTTYAVNDTARSRGFASIEPIRVNQSSGWPRDPLKRVPQDQRKRIFAESTACERDVGRNPSGTTQRKQRLRETRGLSESELKQIEAEGLERLWPPLSQKRVSLDPLVESGLKLCPS